MNSELKPKIRFKGFADDWEQHKLADIGDIITGTTPSTSDESNYNGDYLFVSPADININRYIEKTNTTLSKKGFESGRILNEGSVLFVSIGSTIGKVAQTKKKTTTNQQINAIEVNEKNNNNFIYSLLQKNSNNIRAGASTQAVPILNKTSFSLLEFDMPKIIEQERIGVLFENIDNLIALHQCKCDKLIELKKSLLEKMFPQNNSIIPEIRFKGFTEDWEQRKLSTLIRKPITDGPHETPQLLTSGIPFISVEAIHDGIIDLKKCRGYISEYDDERFKQKYIPEIGDVFFTKAATIGRVAVVDKLGFNIWSPIGAIKPDFSKIISKYLYYVLQTDNIMKEALLGSNSSSQYNLSMDTIENFTINIPKSINEQVEVSKLLANIDNLITLHQRKHDKLNKIKQSLLNDMFV